MAEITSVLFFHVMRYDPKNPRNPAADRFVLSKVNPLRWGILKNSFIS
jgi:transketolase N-terminal domain/subunit